MPPRLRAEDVPTEDLHALFDLCNSRYFNDTLISSPGFELRFSRSEKLSGCFTYCQATRTDWGIQIARRLKDHPLALLSTMVHEMIHMLAHQHYRQTQDPYYLDEQRFTGNPDFSRGHGPFFVGEQERLNLQFPELRITVKSTFGDTLYDPDRIPHVRLLLVHIDRIGGKGMIYRLHPKAGLEWPRLRETALAMHRVPDIAVLRVPGDLAEGFPCLRRDNGARVNMKRLSLRHFVDKVATLRKASGTRELTPTNSVTESPESTPAN